MPDRSKVMTQTIGDNPGPHGWELGVGLKTPPHKILLQTLPKKSQSPPGTLVLLLPTPLLLLLMMVMITVLYSLCHFSD
jgi:hypothetical protein